MRIDNNGTVNGVQGIRSKTVRPVSSASETAAGDSVDLSVRAEDMLTAMDALKSAPEVRQDRVDAVRQQVDTGEYQVDEGAIADKILGLGKS